MNGIERVEAEGQLIAIVLRRYLEKEGTYFVTPPENALQLGVLGHKRGTEIGAHVHINTAHTIESVQEVLHILYGRVQVDFYSLTGVRLESLTLNSGDTILLISGGHGFKILEDSKIIEVKQGPYHGVEGDKKCLPNV
mgnify:CR=1 FL=1